MSIIGIGLVAILLVIALLHLYWGLGGFWPGTDAKSLSERVAGTSRSVASKLVPCVMVASALAAAAASVVLRHVLLPEGLFALIIYGGYVTLILVFGLRGLAPYLTPAFNYARATPFYVLNRKYYAPLCLLIAAGFIIDFPPGIESFILNPLGV